MEKRDLINVTCSNLSCTKPLFAFEVGKKDTLVRSFGAAIRTSPPTLGVDQRAWAVCMHCGTETEFDRALLPPAK